MEQELESMVVRLLGDGSSYMQMMRQAQEGTTQTMHEVQSAGAQIESITNQLKGFTGAALGVLGGLGIRAWLNEALGAYKEQAKADAQLRAMLEVNGRAVEATFASYQRLSEEMMQVAGVADEVVLGMLKQAEVFGITGAAAERATRNLIAAQAAGLPASMRMMAALEQGHSQVLVRLLPALRGIKDEGERAAKAQEMLGNMFKIAELEGSKASVQLKLAWNELMEDFGKTFYQVMKPITEMQVTVVNWLRGLPPPVKEVIVIVASLTAGVLALSGAITLAGFVFNTLFGGVGIIIGAVVTAGTAVAVWVGYLGGVSVAWGVVKTAALDAWEWTKAKALEFWEWFRPVWRAFVGVFSAGWELVKGYASAAWDGIKSAAASVWGFVSEGWSEFFRGFNFSWASIRETVATVLIGIEFAIRNAERFWLLGMLSMTYYTVKFVNDVVHFFTVQMPTAFWWFVREFHSVFVQVFRQLDVMVQDLVANIARVLDRENLRRIIAGEVSVADLWTPLLTSFDVGISPLPEMARRKIGDVERVLRGEFNRLRGQIDEDWNRFRDRRLREVFGPESDILTAAGDLGKETGEAFNQGLGKEMQKTESVLAGSAEALARIAAFQEKVNEVARGGGENRGQAAPNFQANIAGGAAAENNIQIQRDQLEQMRRAANGIERIAARPQVDIVVEDAAI